MDNSRLTGDLKGGTKLSDRVLYDEWEFEARAKLRRKGVLPIVLGDEPRPLGSSGSKAMKAWVSKCDVVMVTIIGRLDPSQLAHVREFEEDPADMWQRLKETHEGIMGTSWLSAALRRSSDASTMTNPRTRRLLPHFSCPFTHLTYDTLIISLDSHTQKDDLDFVIGRLLNEEACQADLLSLPGAVDTP
jgi:hypothetical protein